jgi:hypothetical protein
MSVQTITAQIGTTAHYWFTPQAVVSLTGAGVNVLDIVHGYVSEATDQTPVTLTLLLDNSALWNVYIELQGSSPVVFSGLNVSGGGDLFTLLSSQGWTY